MPSSSTFYSSLPIRERFVEVANPTVYTPVPDDWFVLASDVEGSTQAIRAGRYKEVNTIGASTIVALLNVARTAVPAVEVPFLFGGDGATVLIPPSLLEQAKGALLSTRTISKSVFDLDLRIGVLPVSDIRAGGRELSIARFRISPHYDQAMFMGGGIAFSDKVLKDANRSSAYTISEADTDASADFAGLECRWRDVPSSYGETITLIICATSGSPKGDQTVYREVVQFLEETFDGTDQPISADRMRLTTNPSEVRPMAAFAADGGFAGRVAYQLRTVAENLYFGWAKRTGRIVRGLRPDELIRTTIGATDHRKFDDLLRMVLSTTPELRQHVTTYLNSRSDSGDLKYGMHVSDRVLLTCIVFEQDGPQVHFVDGADGGYAMAAVELKSKLNQ